MLTVEKIWTKVQEFVKRIGDLEDDTHETKKEVGHLRKELQILTKSIEHNDKVLAHTGQIAANLEARIKKLESEKRGLAIKAGKAKAKAARLEQEIKH